MLWRAPWIQQRGWLIALAGWDLAAVFLSYNIVYLNRIGAWEGLSKGLIVALLIWLAASYISGRYSPRSNEEKSVAKLASTSLLAAGCVLAVFITHSWTHQIVDATTRFRGFLLPFCALSVILSCGGQLAIEYRRNKSVHCYGVCTEHERRIIEGELAAETSIGGVQIIFKNGLCLHEFDVQRYIGANQGLVVGALEDEDRETREVLIKMREKGIEIVSIVDWCERYLHRIPPEIIDQNWLIKADGFKIRPGRTSWRVKRLVDIVVASTLLVITSPLFVAACVCIWIEDGMPIFYVQTRTGTNGSKVSIWKLRSMRKDAEASGIQWSTRGDKRITKVGKVIRKLRIDELPQLMAVIVGELSLIGPRPERPELESELERHIPHYRIRHWVRPGLSGWAQVCYPYGASIEDSRNKLSYDIYYIRNGGLLLDALIFLKTVRLVMTGSGSTPRDNAIG